MAKVTESWRVSANGGLCTLTHVRIGMCATGNDYLEAQSPSLYHLPNTDVEMKRVVVSVVSLTWMLFSTSSLAFVLISLFFSSGWLTRIEDDSSFWEVNCQSINQPINPVVPANPLPYVPPSLGPVFSCETACPGHTPARSIRWVWSSGARIYCRFSLWGGGQKPAASNTAAWTGSLLLLTGVCVLLFAYSLLCLSLCKRELCGRSIFQVTGLLQCVAGEACIFRKIS